MGAHAPLTILILAGTLLSPVGCAGDQVSETARPAVSPAATPVPITGADLARLSWIEGAWRGTGDGIAPFYERYHFTNARTLVVETLAGEAADTVNDTTVYELKDGRFSGERSVATAISDSSITFARGANTFRWQKESADVWTAALSSPAGERVYRMERFRPAKR